MEKCARSLLNTKTDSGRILPNGCHTDNRDIRTGLDVGTKGQWAQEAFAYYSVSLWTRNLVQTSHPTCTQERNAKNVHTHVACPYPCAYGRPLSAREIWL